MASAVNPIMPCTWLAGPSWHSGSTELVEWNETVHSLCRVVFKNRDENVARMLKDFFFSWAALALRQLLQFHLHLILIPPTPALQGPSVLGNKCRAWLKNAINKISEGAKTLCAGRRSLLFFKAAAKRTSWGELVVQYNVTSVVTTVVQRWLWFCDRLTKSDNTPLILTAPLRRKRLLKPPNLWLDNASIFQRSGHTWLYLGRI